MPTGFGGYNYLGEHNCAIGFRKHQKGGGKLKLNNYNQLQSKNGRKTSNSTKIRITEEISY